MPLNFQASAQKNEVFVREFKSKVTTAMNVSKVMYQKMSPNMFLTKTHDTDEYQSEY